MTITDADREAAAKALGYRCWADATDYRLTGAQDRQVAHYVQAFARHREQARREALEEAARYIQGNYPHDKRVLVPAIRALIEKERT